MTLHEAIEQILIRSDCGLTPSEMAKVLNQVNLYSKADGSPIKSSQISARVRKCPHLFRKEGSIIYLKSKTGVAKTPVSQPKALKPVSSTSGDANLLSKRLMNEKNFKPITEVEMKVPDVPGMYAIRLSDSTSLVDPFDSELKARRHNLIYIGVASQSLYKRFLGQELRAKGHGTFFRSLGAVLGYRPPHGSLIGKKNQNNYKFSQQDERQIIEWIDQNLLVNWVEYSGDQGSLETELIQRHLPLLNIAKNPGAMQELRTLRAECKRIARGE